MGVRDAAKSPPQFPTGALAGGHSETLIDAVRSVEELLETEDTRGKFRDKLLAYGYLSAHEERYRSTHYTLMSLRVYHVAGTFPRLTQGALPPGIGSVTYRLALDSCAEWSSDPQTLKELLRASGTASA